MKRTKKGFTLVELLVVIAIIAIIAAVAVPVTIGQLKKGRVSNFTQEKEAIVRMVTTGLATAKTGAELKDEITFNKTPDTISKFTLDADTATLVFTITSNVTDDDLGDKATELKTVTLTGVTVPAACEGTYTVSTGTTSFQSGSIS